MSKELDEAWTTIYHYNDEFIHDMGSEYVENPLKEEINIVNNALLELKAIKEAKPSEALECVDDINADLVGLPKHAEEYDNVFDDYLEDISIKINSIKQALIKSQEQEKVLNIIKEKKVSIFQLSCCKNVNEYNDLKFKDNEKLTQEEFDLLKRWLG